MPRKGSRNRTRSESQHYVTYGMVLTIKTIAEKERKWIEPAYAAL